MLDGFQELCFVSLRLDKLLVDKMSEDALHDKSKIRPVALADSRGHVKKSCCRYKEKIKAKDSGLNAESTIAAPFKLCLVFSQFSRS